MIFLQVVKAMVTSSSSPAPPREPVVLNVYDLYWTNNATARLGIGIYHSGVQVRQ